jgi:hypothetical protein
MTAEVDDATLLVDAESRIGIGRLRVQAIAGTDVVIEIPRTIAAIPELTVELIVSVEVDTRLGSSNTVEVDGRILRA